MSSYGPFFKLTKIELFCCFLLWVLLYKQILVCTNYVLTGGITVDLYVQICCTVSYNNDFSKTFCIHKTGTFNISDCTILLLKYNYQLS